MKGIKMTDNNRVFKQINNLQLKWCFLDKTNEKGNYPSHKYEVVLSMDDKQLAEFNTLPRCDKQKVKEVEGRHEIKLKSKNPIRVVNRDGVMMTKEELAKIGNGSIATVKVYSYQGFGGQNFIGISAIKVNKVEEYTGGSSNSFEDDGFDALADF